MDCGSDIWSLKSTFVDKLWNVSLLFLFLCTLFFNNSYYHVKAKVVCTLRTARWASLISDVLLIAFETQFFFIFESCDINGLEVCVYSNEKYASVIETMKSIVYSYVPFIMMGLTSFAIVIKFIMLKRNSGNGHESTNLAVNKSATRGTVTVFLPSITFITLTGPICIYGVITDKQVAVVIVVFLILQYLNHAVNAVLYCLVGSRFRTELMKTIKCCGKKDKPVQRNGSTPAFTISLNTAI